MPTIYPACVAVICAANPAHSQGILPSESKNGISINSFSHEGVSAVPAVTEGDYLTVAGFVSIASQYRLRGISFTDRNPAIQGGATLTHKSGVYIGTWASNLAGYGAFGGSSSEVDALAGYSRAFNRVTFDGGIIHYIYPGAKDVAFLEGYGSISRTVSTSTVKVGANYAWSQKSIADADNLYVFSDLSTPILKTPISLRAHAGWTKGPGSLLSGPSGEYMDWSFGADVAYKRLTLSLIYVDTNIIGRQADAYFKPGGRRISDGATVITLATTF